MCVAEPAANRDRMLWVEDVTGGRVVNDDCLLEVSSNLAEVLDVVALVVVATFTEEPVVHHIVDVELIQ